MRKQRQWPWAPWLRLLPGQLVAWLKTTVAYQKHCADITLPGLMENINTSAVICNALRPENKHRGSSVNWISCGGIFFLFFPSFSVLSQPRHFIKCKSKEKFIKGFFFIQSCSHPPGLVVLLWCTLEAVCWNGRLVSHLQKGGSAQGDCCHSGRRCRFRGEQRLKQVKYATTVMTQWGLTYRSLWIFQGRGQRTQAGEPLRNPEQTTLIKTQALTNSATFHTWKEKVCTSPTAISNSRLRRPGPDFFTQTDLKFDPWICCSGLKVRNWTEYN